MRNAGRNLWTTGSRWCHDEMTRCHVCYSKCKLIGQ